MPKTKSFRVAVEGDTVDGRKIERSWLSDIAATYNPATYGARVNKEHIVGVTGTEPFKAYGDVISCSVEEITLQLGGKPVKRLALNAEIEATDDLVQLVADKQKIYTSIEVAPNFANTGKAGLVGLAVTDTPASLGTEVLSFALKHPGLLASMPRPAAEGNIFSLGLETSFQLAEGETAPAHQPSEVTAAFTAMKNFFSSFGKKEEPAQPATPPPANDNGLAAFAAEVGKMAAGLETLSAKVDGMASKITSIDGQVTVVKATIANTDADPNRRSPALGLNSARPRTDC